MDLLENFMEMPYLKERFVLKGGTVINLFYADPMPHLFRKQISQIFRIQQEHPAAASFKLKPNKGKPREFFFYGIFTVTYLYNQYAMRI